MDSTTELNSARCQDSRGCLSQRAFCDPAGWGRMASSLCLYLTWLDSDCARLERRDAVSASRER